MKINNLLHLRFSSNPLARYGCFYTIFLKGKENFFNQALHSVIKKKINISSLNLFDEK